MCWLYLHEPATNGAQLNVLLLEMWLIFCGHLWYSNGTSQRFFTGITRKVIVIVINVFYCHRVNQSLSTKEMIWLIELGCICCNVNSVRMNVRVVCFDVFVFVWMGLCVWCLCYYTNMAIYFLSGGNEMETSRFSVIIMGDLCIWSSHHWLQSIESGHS